jgi:hypothetical protein
MGHRRKQRAGNALLELSLSDLLGKLIVGDIHIDKKTANQLQTFFLLQSRRSSPRGVDSVAHGVCVLDKFLTDGHNAHLQQREVEGTNACSKM